MDDIQKDYKGNWQKLKADPIRYEIHLAQVRERYAKNRERERERGKLKYQRNKEGILEQHRRWRRAHPDKVREYGAKKYAEHPDRERQRVRDWYEQHKEYFAKRGKDRREGKDRDKWLQVLLRSVHRTRLSPEEFDSLWERSRNGPCEICGLTGEVMHLDHNHATNTYRGILCDGCNRGLGYFRENAESLRKAAAYLEASTGV